MPRQLRHKKIWVLCQRTCALHRLDTEEREISMLKNKMTSCNEFFNRLRKLAFSVDRETNGLKEALENSEVSTYDENRACLLLRETLAEVKDLKVI